MPDYADAIIERHTLTPAQCCAVEGNAHGFPVPCLDTGRCQAQILRSQKFKYIPITDWKVGEIFHRVGTSDNVMVKDDGEPSSV